MMGNHTLSIKATCFHISPAFVECNTQRHLPLVCVKDVDKAASRSASSAVREREGEVQASEPNMMRRTMEMVALSGIPLLLLLLCSIISSTESQTTCDRYAARGEAFAVPLGHQLKDTERVSWKKGSARIVDRRPPIKVAGGYDFRLGSKDDIYPNGSLTLRNVSAADEGEYTPSVYKKDGASVGTLKSVHVCVLGRAPQPTLKVECLKGPKSKVILTCDVGKVQGLTFVWLQNDIEQKKQKTQVWTQELEKVTGSFSCRVSNPLGPRTSESVKGFCQPPFIPDDMWEFVWICVGSGGGLVLLLTIIVIVCCVRAKRKKRFQKIDEEELRLRWANPEQQQQHQCPQHGHPTSRRPQHQGQHQGHGHGQHQGHGHGQPQGQHQHQGHHQGQDQHQKQQQQQQPAGHTGPRQHRSKQHRPRAPEPPPNHPQPSPIRAAQTNRADVNGDEEQAPPLPKPRSKTRTRV